MENECALAPVSEKDEAAVDEIGLVGMANCRNVYVVIVYVIR